jgi:hypothetical protein
MPRESAIERYLVRRLKSIGLRADKYVTPGRRNAPDRIVLLGKGRVFFVECKAPGEKPRPGQKREHLRLRNLGYLVETVDSRETVNTLVEFWKTNKCI